MNCLSFVQAARPHGRAHVASTKLASPKHHNLQCHSATPSSHAAAHGQATTRMVGGAAPVHIGVLGGGQLGRMMALAAANMGVKMSCLDASDPAPAAVAAHHTVGCFTDRDAIESFVSDRKIDLLTVEIEHVNVDAIEAVQESLGVEVQPCPTTLRIIQDKFRQKEHFSHAGVTVAEYVDVPTEAAALRAGENFEYPFMMKSKREAYDGRGNAVISSREALPAAVAKLGGYEQGLYAEKWAPFTKELAVMVARSTSGHLQSYPVVQTLHRNSILLITEAPAAVAPAVAQAATVLAEKAVGSLIGAGIFGVEMFLMPDGGVILNEVAPRPHNSGHYTMDACATSQFEQALRAILGWPLGSPDLLPPVAIMYNLLGVADGEEGLEAARETMSAAYATPSASVHWYGKAECRSGRKIGHVNISAAGRAAARAALDAVAPGASAALGPLPAHAKVAIIMGSDSDLPTMAPAAQVLKDFGVPCSVSVVSAHRTPERMLEFARTVHERGVKVIIAGAGGAAHLPGMVAAMTPLPVIGVPVTPAGAHLDGLDALLSIVQMPRGVPVATVAIGNATNAGLLAVRVLGAHESDLRELMSTFQSSQRSLVEGKAAQLESKGWEAYLDEMLPAAKK